MNTTQKKFFYSAVAVLSVLVMLGFGGARGAVFAAQPAMMEDAPNPAPASHLTSQHELVSQSSSGGEGDSMELSGTVESFDGTTLMIDGKTVLLTDATEVKGSIQPGDMVKVEIIVAEDGSLIASEVEPVHSSFEDGSSHDTNNDHNMDQSEVDDHSSSGQNIHEDDQSTGPDQSMHEDDNSTDDSQEMHEDDQHQDDQQDGSHQDGSYDDGEHHDGDHNSGHD